MISGDEGRRWTRSAWSGSECWTRYLKLRYSSTLHGHGSVREYSQCSGFSRGTQGMGGIVGGIDASIVATVGSSKRRLIS